MSVSEEIELSAARERISLLEEENRQLRDLLMPHIEAILPSYIANVLTPREQQLLGAIVTRPAVVATREMILRAMYDCPGDEPPAKIIDVLMVRLRRKIEPFGIEIETIWGRGYIVGEKSRPLIEVYRRRAQQESSVDFKLPALAEARAP